MPAIRNNTALQVARAAFAEAVETVRRIESDTRAVARWKADRHEPVSAYIQASIDAGWDRDAEYAERTAEAKADRRDHRARLANLRAEICAVTPEYLWYELASILARESIASRKLATVPRGTALAEANTGMWYDSRDRLNAANALLEREWDVRRRAWRTN